MSKGFRAAAAGTVVAVAIAAGGLVVWDLTHTSCAESLASAQVDAPLVGDLPTELADPAAGSGLSGLRWAVELPASGDVELVDVADGTVIELEESIVGLDSDGAVRWARQLAGDARVEANGDDVALTFILDGALQLAIIDGRSGDLRRCDTLGDQQLASTMLGSDPADTSDGWLVIDGRDDIDFTVHRHSDNGDRRWTANGTGLQPLPGTLSNPVTVPALFSGAEVSALGTTRTDTVLWVWDSASGSLLWTLSGDSAPFEVRGIVGQVDDTLYVVGRLIEDGPLRLFAHDAQSGGQLWDVGVDITDSDALLAEIIGAGDGLVLIGSDATLGLDAENGATTWRQFSAGSLSDRGSIGATPVAGTSMLAQAGPGRLLDPNTGAIALLWEHSSERDDLLLRTRGLAVDPATLTVGVERFVDRERRLFVVQYDFDSEGVRLVGPGT